MFRNYLITAWRNLWKNKIYTLINIAGLAIGLACCMLIILYNKDEVSFDRFHSNAPNIFHVVSKITSPDGQVTKMVSTGNRPGPALKDNLPEVKDFVRLQEGSFNVRKGEDVLKEEGYYTDENFFSFFSFKLKEGNRSSVLNDLHSVVLSEDLAEKYFVTGSAIGKSLEINTGKGFETFIVSGVAENSPENSSIQLKLILPRKLQDRDNPDDMWLNFFQNTFISLAPGTDIKTVERKFAQVYAASAKDQIKQATADWGFKDKIEYELQPLLAMHLDTEYINDNGLYKASNPVYSYILSAIALFLLVIACINFINLSIARSLNRAKEIGIRKVVGSERKQLIVQFLGESFLLSFFGFAFAIILVASALPFFNVLANKALSFSYLFDLRLVLWFGGLLILSGLLAGFYPALILSRFNPVDTLYGRTRFAGKDYLSKGLIVLQFSLATFLIFGTITIYSQFNFLTHYKLGYDDNNLAIFYPGPVDAKKANLLAEELKKNPAIEMVAAKNDGMRGTKAKVDGKEIEIVLEIIGKEYVPTLGLNLAAGNNLTAASPADSANSILVNETFVKNAGWQDAIGKKVGFFWDSTRLYTVVGVIKDYYFGSLKEPIRPQLFTMDRRNGGFGQLLVKINPRNTASAIQYAQKVFRNLLPLRPFRYDFKKDLNDAQYASEHKWKQIISSAAVLTIFVSCIGLFGLASLAARKRVREIGIRKVLGAGTAEIIKKLSTGFMLLVILASLIAIPAAWLVANKWLQNYPLRIEITIWTFLIALLVTMAISLLTVATRAFTAARANPVKNLKTE